ncbi:MAG: peptidoglycan DD-metalloendopeptidase family protein [Oscillospiraceae bacterium]|nr:peptidoglycan DD-metalloendopeptidase family protein [Oscillospiraceae bacterium]
MSNTGSRKPRHFFDGTGAYIALFLVVTALAVAGYWTLIPRSSTTSPAQKPVTETAPHPDAPSQVSTAQKPNERQKPDTPEPEPRVEAAAPAQNIVTVTLPPEPVVADFTPSAPVLVVDPLVGETVAAFSMDALVYDETMGDWRTHDGVDLAADPGTPVCAACAGTVIDVRDDDLMGTTVVLSHDGGYDTIYSNLQSEPTVMVGDYVTAGQMIGSVGSTALGESALAPHLHFSVTKDGEFIDPNEYLKK